MFKSLIAKFLVFLASFSFLMALLIYVRETWDQYHVALSTIILWQLAIWLPWGLSIKPLNFLADKLGRGLSVSNMVLFSATVLILITMHISYFFAVSHFYSPLNGLPHTGYGVYPYFFIFFSMIDIVIVWGLSARIGIFQILETPPSKKTDDIITVKKGANQILIRPSDIRWIAAEDYYSKLYTDTGDHLLRQPLKVLVDRLPESIFIQIHRSTIVNMNFVKVSDKKSVTLTDGTVRRMSREGFKRFSQYI